MTLDVPSLAVPGIRNLKPYQPGKPVEALEREYGVSNALKLASNENPLGPSPKAMQAVQNIIRGINYYPDAYALTAKLAEHHGVSSQSITLGNGSNDILDLVARVFLDTKRNSVFSEHAFAVYPISTQAAGASMNIAKALPTDHPSMPYGHDLEAILAEIDPHTRVVFIANPNNPTGTWFGKQELTDFLDKVPADVIVVLDEAYTEYVAMDDFPNGIKLLAHYPNLIVTRTFSKIYGLAGLRIGYSVSSAAITDLLNRVRQPFNVNNLALAAAIAALDDQEFVQQSAAMNLDGMRQLAAGFEELGLVCMPSAANFLTVDTSNDAAKIYDALLYQGVIVRPVANYGLPRHLRVTIGTREQNQRVLDAFAAVLK